MLQKLRQYSKSTVSNILMGILSLAFVSWGVGDILQGRITTAVVTVGKTAVDQTEFQRDYNNALRSLGIQRGGSISPETARREHLADTLLQQTIADTAIYNVTEKLGLTAPDAVITTQIRAMPQFAGLNGTFDKNSFNQAISNYNYSEQGFIDLMRRGLARNQLERAAAGNFLLPLGYARALLAFSTEARAADYIVLNDASLPPIAAPADAVLAAYVKAHAGSYSTPEYRDVTFTKVGPEDVAGQINVTEAQIKQAYENQKSKYVIDEKRTIERLTFQNQQDAAAAKAKIAAGQSFADAVKARGFKPSDVALGDVVAKDLDADAAKVAFAAKEGGVTDPVKSTFGWNLFHVVKIIPGKTVALDQVRADITEQVRQELARAKLDDISNTYTDAVTSGLSLAEAAKKVGFPVNHVVAVDRAGLAQDGSKAALPDDAEFRELIFKADVGEEGDPIMTKAGTLYVIQVNGVVPPKLKALDKVRDKALAAWTAEQRALLLKKRAMEVAAQASREKSLDAAAKAAGVSVQHSKALTRETADDTFSATLIEAFFTATPGAAVSGPVGKGGGYVVARVAGIAHRLPAENSALFVRAVRMLSQGTGNDIVQSLAYAARERQGVTINRKLLDSAVGSNGEGS
jgi:peptidyl-prolyl cis-trans isomerase D